LKTIRYQVHFPDGHYQSITCFKFEEVGEELPIHQHTFFHGTCVTAGQIEVYDDTGKSVILGEGNHTGFNSGRLHAIKAVQVPAEIIQVQEIDT
jgi:hypothetical protein